MAYEQWISNGDVKVEVDGSGTISVSIAGDEKVVIDGTGISKGVLPVGVVLMYDGTGIADVATRTEDIGDRAGDTISMPGWKVCNGNGGTPNLLNKFIRSESASGNTGGSDDSTHSHTVNNHAHPYLGRGQRNYILGTGFKYTEGESVLADGQDYWTGGSSPGTNGQTGGTDNRPAYYSLIFIKKVA